MRAHAGSAPEDGQRTATEGDAGSAPEGGQRTALSRLLAPIGLVVLAAILRLPNLATRGTWDGDQGHDMLVLRALVRDGTIPLVGPPTSLGDVHHGAFYYYLLSPAAFLTGGDSPTGCGDPDRAGGDRRGGRHVVAGALDRRRRGRFHRRAGDGGVHLRRRRIDLHLEPERDRAVECGGAGRCVAGVVDRAAALVAAWPGSGPR